MRLLAVACCVLTAVRAEICTDAVCEYTLEIRRWNTMTYGPLPGEIVDSTYDVDVTPTGDLVLVNNSWHLADDPMIGTTVSADDVITADGFRRTLITVNGQFPGPAIEVMKGAQVVVHVENELLLESTTIHWHGLHMRETPWMDGVGMLTQCPIMPGQSYTHRFFADPVGTHWYHAHVPGQRVDGLYGFLIVHDTMPRYPSYNIFVTDWSHADIITSDVDSALSMRYQGSGRANVWDSDKYYMPDNSECGAIAFYSALVGGRGRFDGKPLPLTEYMFTQGDRYRLRLINSGTEYAFEISIDQHLIEVVAIDGNEIVPITVTSFMLFAGETIDVEVMANQPVDRYWMRVNILATGIGPNATETIMEVGGKAIVIYEGDTSSGDPTSSAIACTSASPCTVFNCPYGFYKASYNKNCVSIADARSIMSQAELDDMFGLQTSDDQVIERFVNINLPGNMNGRRNTELPVPITHERIGEFLTPCGEECDRELCFCVHTDTLPYNRTIQLVLTSKAPGFPQVAHHTLHLHGHNFAVLKMGVAPQDDTTGFWTGENTDVTCTSPDPATCNTQQWTASRPLLNKVSPPVKDTLVIPARGYVVIRFRSDNPGYWMLHCHQEMHVLEGMAMTWVEAKEHIKPVPQNFPTCGGFDWSEEDFNDYLNGDMSTTNPTVNTPCPSVPAVPEQTTTRSGDDRVLIPVDMMLLSRTSAIGAAFGFVIVGAVLTLIPVMVFVCCAKRNSDK